MKFVKPTKVDYQIFWVSIIVVIIAITYLMYGERVWKEWKILTVTSILLLPIGWLSMYAHVQYNRFIEWKLPYIQNIAKRIFFKLIANIFVMSPSIFLFIYTFHFFKINGYQIQENDLKYGYLIGLFINIMVGGFLECVYLLDKYKETVAEKELLEKLQLDQEFDQLKQKVNPHFLFNCFNTLSSLISEDKTKAEQFLDELSKVYRYLLRNNEDGMSTLNSELKFIQNYFQLLKTRYGDAVFLKQIIDEKYLNYQLPSLSLQLLVENAVKHNSLTKSKPLFIEIFTDENSNLLLKNNIQSLTVKAISNKIGLKNIQEKYDLLKKEGFKINHNAETFTVTLPLIMNKNIEK
jgi:two-component system LytT family sensor kinase